ncbi:hypothetical protein CJ010_00690 [Azoarcus sp. DD4]|uniref:hypothetical protein n=1 Tax=Azoarcus sp. DD4 TaxID=2027405 RepID=UPI001126F1EC|nr:hypothetical protein [Azoarcus sp. DD4]QDF95170.1 hypothetical protein CJ010_00690 [Azoarcus sp. DD4]
MDTELENAREAVARLASYLEGSSTVQEVALKLIADTGSPFYSRDVIAHTTPMENAISGLLERIWGVFDDGEAGHDA